MGYMNEDLMNKSELRNKLIDRIDVLNKVKELFLIPKLEMMNIRMVADFYEVDTHTINRVYDRHWEEIISDGVKMIKISELMSSEHHVHLTRKPKDNAYYVTLNNGKEIRMNAKTTYFSPRAVLRIGMLLRDSEVAKEVRTQLLNTFECATEEQRLEKITEEDKLLLAIFHAKDDKVRAEKLCEYLTFKDRYITQLENEKANLQTELNVAHNNIATWSPQDIMKCLIASIAHTIRGENKFAFAWGRLKKNLYHRHGINLEARKVRSGRNKPYVAFIKDDEWDKVIQECYALAKEANVDIVQAIGSINAKSLEKYDELIANRE